MASQQINTLEAHSERARRFESAGNASRAAELGYWLRRTIGKRRLRAHFIVQGKRSIDGAIALDSGAAPVRMSSANIPRAALSTAT